MTEQPEYACWAEHAENLTEAVRREQESPGEWTLRYERSQSDAPDQRRKIVVQCSEGHMNTFEL